MSQASSTFSYSYPELRHSSRLQSRPLPAAVYPVCIGMSTVITKSHPSPPCLFSDHLIKEMSVPKPYAACSYTQGGFSAKSGSFASGISQHTSKISIYKCISLHSAVHGKQTLEDHSSRKQSPGDRSSEEPLSTAVFVAILPLSLAKEVRRKSSI